MTNKITILLVFFFTIFFVSKSFSAQIKIEAFGMDKYFNYDVDKGRQFLTYSNEGLFMTDIGINGVVECKGIIEVITGTTSSNIMCKYIEENGDYNFTQFYTQRGDNEEYGVQKFQFVFGTGRWEKLVGLWCKGAGSALPEGKYMWKGKCELPDDLFNEVKSYKKPE